MAYGGVGSTGTQITPPGVAQTNDENVFGGDVQWTLGRGIRGEFVHANRPSTFLARSRCSRRHSSKARVCGPLGRAVTGALVAHTNQQAYVRFDRLAGDIVQLCPDEKDGSCKINAVNGGFGSALETRPCWRRHSVEERLSFNQEPVNTRLQITSSLVF